ncbi:signal peptidase II, partial [bacterium]|nr:signal peptidase II [bacterium]
IFGIIFILDIISKWIVTHTMVLYQSIPLLGQILKLTYVRNTGAAFSLLANVDSPWRTAFLIAVKSVAVIVLTIVAYYEQRRDPRLMLPLGLVCAGAMGNLLDRVTTGTVVDFIEVSYRTFHFPVFNVADSAVVIGVSWLLLITFQTQFKSPDS